MIQLLFLLSFQGTSVKFAIKIDDKTARGERLSEKSSHFYKIGSLQCETDYEIQIFFLSDATADCDISKII